MYLPVVVMWLYVISWIIYSVIFHNTALLEFHIFLPVACVCACVSVFVQFDNHFSVSPLVDVFCALAPGDADAILSRDNHTTCTCTV